jgi:uncharacterized protein
MNGYALAVSCALLLSCRSEGKERKPNDALPVAPPKNEPAVKNAVTDVSAQDFVMPALAHARVSFAGAKQKVVVDAEVASTGPQRTRGLMWRTSLPEGTGMLFIFTREQPLSFWMRNTLIPLDMAFIAADGSVVNVIANAEPRTLVARPSAAPALYVLEVPGGWAQKVGLKAGLQLKLEGIESLPAEP